MNYRNIINSKVDIYSVKTELSENNIWQHHEIFWKSVWSIVRIINLRAKQRQYQFISKWIENFPSKFVVQMNGQKYQPIQDVISDKNNDITMFFATKKDETK